MYRAKHRKPSGIWEFLLEAEITFAMFFGVGLIWIYFC